MRATVTANVRARRRRNRHANPAMTRVNCRSARTYLPGDSSMSCLSKRCSRRGHRGFQALLLGLKIAAGRLFDEIENGIPQASSGPAVAEGVIFGIEPLPFN